MLQVINKVRARLSGSSRQTPKTFGPPPGGAAYFGQAARWEQILHFKYWAFVAIRAWMRHIAGGPPPNIGRIYRDEKPSKKRVHRKSGMMGGPQQHERFEAYDYDHPLRKLFRNPNKPDVAYDLWAWHVLYLKLTGESHWWVVRNAFGVPVELWVIPTHWKRLNTEHHGLPSSYTVQSPWGEAIEVPYDEVTSFYEQSPLSRYEGWAVNQAVGEWIDAYEANIRAQLAQYKNGAIPAFHVQLGETYGDPDERQLNRYYAKWFARFRGENNTGKPVITGGDVDIKPLGINPVDMGYQQTEERIRDMTLAAYEVPKAVVGLQDGMTYGSVAAALDWFFTAAINPELMRDGQVISEKIVATTPGCEDGVCFWDERAASDPEKKQQKIEFQIANGLLTPNEGRTEYGNEPYEHGGDDPIVGGVEMPWATGDWDRAIDNAIVAAVASGGAERATISEDEESVDPAIGQYTGADSSTSMPSLNGQAAGVEAVTEALASGALSAPQAKSILRGMFKNANVDALVQSMQPGGEVHRAVQRKRQGDSTALDLAFKRALGESSGPSGGYLVPPEFFGASDNGHGGDNDNDELIQLRAERRALTKALAKSNGSGHAIQQPVAVAAAPQPINLTVNFPREAIRVDVAAPVVNNRVETPEVRVTNDVHVPQAAPPTVEVNVPQGKAPVVHVDNRVAAPHVTNVLPKQVPPDVVVNNNVEVAESKPQVVVMPAKESKARRRTIRAKKDDQTGEWEVESEEKP